MFLKSWNIKIKIDKTYSGIFFLKGSTCVGVYLNQNKLYCANLGDSRAIIGKYIKNW